MVGEILVSFENQISADFLMKWPLVKVSGMYFQQNRVLSHVIVSEKWLVELR